MKKIKNLNLILTGLFILAVGYSYAEKSGTGHNELTKEQKENAVVLINKVRLQGCTCGTEYMHPVQPVVWDTIVEDVALEHCTNMNQVDRFGHSVEGEVNMVDRLYSRGFELLAVGENIGIGQKTEEELIDDWIYKSSGHCKTLMHPKLKYIGLAKAGRYWTLNMIGLIGDQK